MLSSTEEGIMNSALGNWERLHRMGGIWTADIWTSSWWTGSSLSDIKDHSAQRKHHVVAYGKEHEALRVRNCMHP